MYESKLNIFDTQIAIKKIKDIFEKRLVEVLKLKRVTAPLFLDVNNGLNDNLNGFEKPVTFNIKNSKLEIVHSLAKWKRYALWYYGFRPYQGLYTDMNAIRKDENIDNLHSIYVDQWDWEKIILKEDRTIDYLKETVKKIYGVLKETNLYICNEYPVLKYQLPNEIYFITTQELEDLYPNLNAKERENKIVREKKAVFLIGIGGKLKSGKIHDGRSPDYDDWDLNGDIILYHEQLDIAFELSSMGIRVDKDSLIKQLNERGELNKLEFDFHKNIINEKLPLTIGGGIGQSRMCMFFLEKMHIGEVQSSFWPEEEKEKCLKNNIILL